jgi:hypothetical protein
VEGDEDESEQDDLDAEGEQEDLDAEGEQDDLDANVGDEEEEVVGVVTSDSGS